MQWAPRSLGDLRRIEDWLDRIEPSLAVRIVDEIETKIELLPDFPFAGPAIGHGRYRRLSIVRFGHVVVYRVDGETVRIVSVCHVKEDWRPL